MLTVRLHGHLEEKYGSEFKFEASTVREVLDALQANFSDFTEEFIKDGRAYSVIVDSETQELQACYMPIKTNSTIDIIPAIGGAGFGKALGMIFVAFLLLFPPTAAAIGSAIAASGGGAFTGALGAVLQGASAAAVISGTTTVAATLGALTAVGLQSLAWGLALAGVASLLAGPDGPDGGGASSSSLSQTENIVGQGMPIPIGYGRMMVGSLVLSATFISSYTIVGPAWTYTNTETGLAKDFTPTNQPASQTDNTNSSIDGTLISNLVTQGYGSSQWVNLLAYTEQAIGGGTYEVVNHTTSSGKTIAAPVYRPPQIAGSYDSSKYNHRS